MCEIYSYQYIYVRGDYDSIKLTELASNKPEFDTVLFELFVIIYFSFFERVRIIFYYLRIIVHVTFCSVEICSFF